MPPKKKKGHAPTHQNKFAFQHNPKSKKTAKILDSPIYHCCRRCHDKLVWRKQYRKYKPLTQPSTCNFCKKRNVVAAYHTICKSCTQTSLKAQELLKRWNDATIVRVCAVCVKEPALNNHKRESNDNNASTTTTSIDPNRPLKLRQLKTLQRQQARASATTVVVDNNDDLSVDMLDEEDAHPFGSTGEAYRDQLVVADKKDDDAMEADG